jgi:hypothetical protein
MIVSRGRHAPPAGSPIDTARVKAGLALAVQLGEQCRNPRTGIGAVLED